MDGLEVSNLDWPNWDLQNIRHKDEVKRLVIFDGPNLMHLTKGRGQPNICGCLSLLRYFLQNDFEVCVVLSTGYISDKNIEHSANLMRRLIRAKIVHVIQKNIIDDIIMLELSKRTGGVILSRDLYRDHFANPRFSMLKENVGLLKCQAVNSRQRHTKTKNGHYVANHTFSFPNRDFFFSMPDNITHELVVNQRKGWSTAIRNRLLGVVEDTIIEARKIDIIRYNASTH